MCVIDQQAPKRSAENQEHLMRWMLFVVVLILALCSSIVMIMHGASLSPALSIPFLMLAWIMRFLFPSRSAGTTPMITMWLASAIARNAAPVLSRLGRRERVPDPDGGI